MKKCALFLTIIALASAVFSFTAPANTYAAPDCNTEILGMKSWCYNVDLDGDKTQEQLKADAIQIGANVLSDIIAISSYICLGFVIYGGYIYMMSTGEPGKAATAKKTLTNSFIGLAIVAAAYVIFGAIRIALLGTGGTLNGNGDVNNMVANLIEWFIGISGVVAAIFIVYGGVTYITAAGDVGKLAKAKKAITYALIGLAIVGISELIVKFFIKTSNDAVETSYITLIEEEKA